MHENSWLDSRAAELAVAVTSLDRARAEKLLAHTLAEGGAESAEYVMVELITRLRGLLAEA